MVASKTATRRCQDNVSRLRSFRLAGGKRNELCCKCKKKTVCIAFLAPFSVIYGWRLPFPLCVLVLQKTVTLHLPCFCTVMKTEKFKESVVSALPGTWKSSVWLLKLMIPISLAVTLMQHLGVLAWIAVRVNPLFVHLGLPGESSVAFLSGAAAGTYAGLAAMMSIPLTMKQASILALMIALCHSLPM